MLQYGTSSEMLAKISQAPLLTMRGYTVEPASTSSFRSYDPDREYYPTARSRNAACRHGLSFEHHKAVASLDEREQDWLLERAQAKRLVAC
jgi:hypothetical protein